MASLCRGWSPMQALLPPSCALRYASLAVTRCLSIAPSPSGRRCLVTTAKAKAKRAPRKKVKETTEPNDDTAAQDPRLPTLSLAALRDLAILCGRNSSGTRAVLRADLEAAINEATPAQKGETTPPPPIRILSIDMGVRNLAYCLLHVAAPVPGQDHHAVPTLMAWERLALVGAGANAEAEDSTTVTSPSAFSPPVMAAAAARLVRDRLLPWSPTHVLIERQRFRSGGAAAVLEWTVRVNSLEAMLHGIFAYRQLGRSAADNTVQAVQAVSPQRASRFLLQGGMGGSSFSPPPPSTRKTKEKDIKDVKEAFVAGLLRAPGPTLAYDKRVRAMVDAYLVRWDAKQSRGRSRSKDATAKTEDGTPPKSPPTPTSSEQPALIKIDDLADCVAQGLVWLAWEGNKTTLREKGAEEMLALKQLTG